MFFLMERRSRPPAEPYRSSIKVWPNMNLPTEEDFDPWGGDLDASMMNQKDNPGYCWHGQSSTRLSVNVNEYGRTITCTQVADWVL